MHHVIHNSIVNFIWGITDDVLHDVYVRGKCRDVILPMTVIRSSRLRLYPDKFLSMRVVCPLPEEQQSIVRFLKVRKIWRRKDDF
jgi:hypothetical protein